MKYKILWHIPYIVPESCKEDAIVNAGNNRLLMGGGALPYTQEGQTGKYDVYP